MLLSRGGKITFDTVIWYTAKTVAAAESTGDVHVSIVCLATFFVASETDNNVEERTQKLFSI